MAKTLTLTEADNGRAVHVRQGDVVVVRLRENPTTGYRWTVDEGESSLIKVHQPEYAGPGTSKAGGSGEVTWRIEATAPGTVEIRLKLSRSWKGDSSILQRFEVALTIAP